MAATITIDENMEREIIRIYKTNPNINTLTQQVFKNLTLDGRSKEGRAIREFLVSRGLGYKTTETKKREDIELTDEQKAFVRDNCSSMRTIEMAKVLFPRKQIHGPLNKECRVIFEYIRVGGLKARSGDDAVSTSYTPPRNIRHCVLKINEYTFQDLVEDELSAQNKRNVESLIRFMQAPRYIQIVNSYINKEDRTLIESEFVRYVWNKPDLTNEEITLYINACIDIVNSKRLLRHVESLNQIFEEAVQDAGAGEAQNQLTVRLSETIKAKADEYHKIQGRIEKALNDLNGKRSARLNQARGRNSNFLALVEVMQEEKERKKLVLLSKSNRLKAKDEADRMESMPELKARIFGTSKNDLI
jgi:hypothetical protein